VLQATAELSLCFRWCVLGPPRLSTIVSPFHPLMFASRLFSRRWLRVFCCVVAFYICFWFVTHFVGVGSVYHTVKAGMPITPQFAYTDVQRRVRGSTFDPIYFCQAVAYGPFLVRADYGWQSGPLSGDGGSDFYLWFFGYTSRIWKLDHWMI